MCIIVTKIVRKVNSEKFFSISGQAVCIWMVAKFMSTVITKSKLL